MSTKSADAVATPRRRPALGHGWVIDAPTAACAPGGENNRLPPSCLFSSLTRYVVTRMVAARHDICCKGDRGTHVFAIVSGRAKVTVPSEDGKEITLRILEPGETFGEVAVLEGTDYEATVTALEPTEVAMLERAQFLKLLAQYPDMVNQLLLSLCQRLRQTIELTEDLSFLPLPRRLAKKLLTLARTYGEPIPQGQRIRLHLCQQELANLVGTSRESINKQLGLWQTEGLIEIKQGCIIICRLHKDAVQPSKQWAAG